MKQKKIPLRRCNGCNEMKRKRARQSGSQPGGRSFARSYGKKARQGRLCLPQRRLPQKAIKSHRFEREFNCEIPQEVYDLMEKEMNESGE